MDKIKCKKCKTKFEAMDEGTGYTWYLYICPKCGQEYVERVISGGFPNIVKEEIKEGQKV